MVERDISNSWRCFFITCPSQGRWCSWPSHSGSTWEPALWRWRRSRPLSQIPTFSPTITPWFLSQLHDLMFCSFKSSQTPCFHIVHPTTEVLAIHVFLRTQNCGACSVLSVTDGVQPPTDWGSLWQEQAPHPPSTSTDCCKSYHAFPLSEASPWLQTCYVVSCDYRLHPDRYKPNSWDLDKVDLNNRLSIKILCRKLCSQKN